MFLNGEYGHKSSAVHRSGYICRPFQQRIGVVERATGCSSARLECYVRDVEAGGSNPLTPTVQSPCNAVAGAFSWKAKPSGAGARAFHERAREQSEPGGALGAPPWKARPRAIHSPRQCKALATQLQGLFHGLRSSSAGNPPAATVNGTMPPMAWRKQPFPGPCHRAGIPWGTSSVL